MKHSTCINNVSYFLPLLSDSNSGLQNFIKNKSIINRENGNKSIIIR